MEPTPVQAEVIPVVLRGADLRCLAPTGSGKTAAFALPVLERLFAQPPRAHTPQGRLRVLVLVPTRELAVQVGEVFRGLGSQLPGRLKVAVLSGGVSVNPQMMGLRSGADVVVATPGRLLDLLERNALRLSGVQALVLDEADHLLELGFSEELSRILALLPAPRQTLFFSATFPAAVEALAAPWLHEPVRLELAGADEPLPAIAQRAIWVDPERRTELLRKLIQDNGWTRVLVFVATRYATGHVAWKLHKGGLYATPLHGEMSQSQRTEVLRQFKSGGFDVMVTTDLAARGIHIDGLEVVVNYDLPRSPVQYVHRIGRTGRAGQAGEAISFVSADTAAHFALIEKRQGLVLSKEVVAGFEPKTTEVPLPQANAAAGNGGIKGRRPSKKDKLRAAAAAAAAATKVTST